MTLEVLLAIAYAAALLVGALLIEWLSIHTHNRSQQFRTAGFEYEEEHDFWVCHQGEQLWPAEYDREKRLVRYRAKASVCQACPVRDSCTDSPGAREITKAIDPWPHSEAGRFHRGIAVMMVVLALFILLVELARNHAPRDLLILAPLFVVTLALVFWLGRDLVTSPSGFPEPKPSHGNRLVTGRGNE